MKIQRVGAVLLLLSMFLFPAAGCGKQKEKANTDRGLCIALTGEGVASSFASYINPLYASCKEEFCLGTLVAPTVMRYDEKDGWIKVLGTITTRVENGKTVATVTLDKSIRYSNDRSISISAYVKVMERITRWGYEGYYKDFYKNPIEGLVSFRYNCQGLTLDDIPDFDAELDKIFADLSTDDYRAMLLETDIAGLYTDAQNPESIAPDGRSFKEIVLEESGREDVHEENFFLQQEIKSLMPQLLSEIYASKPKAQWMIDELRTLKNNELQRNFEEECRKSGALCPSIPGVSSGSGYNSDNCTVTFSTVVDENEAIRMLNLPVIYSYTLDASTPAVGAGAYICEGANEGRDGCVFRFTSEEGNLSVATIARENILDTMFMGQIGAVALNTAPTDSENARIKENNLEVKRIGSSYVVFDPHSISEKALDALSTLFG